jgi:glycosyltransferase involved in cell wall biosynthesis
MRIHLVTDQFSLGGGLEHIYQVARGLKEHLFHIYGNPGNPEAYKKFKELKNVMICDWGYSPEIVMEGNPDIVHIHHLRPLLSYLKWGPHRMIKGKKRIPLVFTAHGLHIHKYEFRMGLAAKIKYRLRYRLENSILPDVDRVIAVSFEDKQFLEEKYRLNNVQYLTNGIDIERIMAAVEGSPDQRVLRKRLGLPEDEFLFVTVARFDFQKGYDIQIDAIHRFIQSRKNDSLVNGNRKCRFILVGDGDDFDLIKRRVHELQLEPFIIFMGARTDVYDIMRAGDALLLASRWEGLPIVLLETGLLKVPVIASDTYGNREVVGNGNGILFENLNAPALAQTLVDVLNDKYDLKAKADRLYREILDHYNLETMVEGLRNLYTDLAEQ